MGLFGRRRRSERPQAQIYEDLRSQVLDLTAAQLGDAYSEAPFLALLMETGYPEAVATLIGVVDGSTSLYFSNGGGIIGAGDHAAVADATARWLEEGVAVLPGLSAISDPPLPAPGIMQFVAVTRDGLVSAQAPEADLGEGRHELSRFFYAAQDVITQIRVAKGD